MKRKSIIRLTETDLHNMIGETVSKLLREYKEEGDLDHRDPDSVYDDYNDDYDKAEDDFLRDIVKNSDISHPFNKKEQNDYSWSLFTKRNDEKEKLNTDYYRRQRQNNWLNLEQAQSAFFKYAYLVGIDLNILKQLHKCLAEEAEKRLKETSSDMFKFELENYLNELRKIRLGKKL